MESDSFFSSSSSDFFSPVNEARDQLRYHLIDSVLQNTDTSGMPRHERSEFIDYLHYNSPFSSFHFEQTLANNPQFLTALQPHPHSQSSLFLPGFHPLMQQPYVPHPSPVANMVFVVDDERSTDYEDLLDLQERIGIVNVGLSEETISKNLKTSHIRVVKDDAGEVCVVCQEEYKDNDMIGSLDECGHRYHASCIKNWLFQKNICPLCKATALVI